MKIPIRKKHLKIVPVVKNSQGNRRQRKTESRHPHDEGSLWKEFKWIGLMMVLPNEGIRFKKIERQNEADSLMIFFLSRRRKFSLFQENLC